jgi:hypothetical protein
MASTSASFNKGGKGLKKQDANLPSLAAMAVNDTKTITGAKMTMMAVRKLCASRQGKLFTFRRASRHQYVITRLK